MTKPLNSEQVAVLRVVARLERLGLPSTATEVNYNLHGRGWGTAGNHLGGLKRRGLAECFGSTPSGARTWRITDAGRTALEGRA
jgi:hypothetical protein